MSRRSTPERLHEVRRAGIVARLIADGEVPARAEALVAAWEAEAAAYRLDPDDVRYWERGWAWMRSRRR